MGFLPQYPIYMILKLLARQIKFFKSSFSYYLATFLIKIPNTVKYYYSDVLKDLWMKWTGCEEVPLPLNSFPSVFHSHGKWWHTIDRGYFRTTTVNATRGLLIGSQEIRQQFDRKVRKGSPVMCLSSWLWHLSCMTEHEYESRAYIHARDMLQHLAMYVGNRQEDEGGKFKNICNRSSIYMTLVMSEG